MKRPMLVCGISVLLTGTFLMLLPESLPYIIPLCALVFIIYLIKPLNLRKQIIIPVFLIVSVLLSASLMIFNKTQINPYIGLDGSTGYICGKVISSPKKLSYSDNYQILIKAEKINSIDADTNLYVFISDENAAYIDIFDIISIDDCLITIPKTDDGKFDFSSVSDGIFLEGQASDFTFSGTATKTPYYYCLLFRENLNKSIDTYLLPDDSALLKGMLFGETTDIPYDTKEAFRNSGIAHLLAVSGLHTTLWCGLIISILSVFKIPQKLRNSLCIIFLLGFCAVTGFTPSVVRSAFMTGIILIAPFFKRRPDSLNSLGLSVLFIILNNPYTILSISFQLSAAATLGVLCSLPTAEKLSSYCNKLPERRLIKLCKSSVSTAIISLFGGLFTLPLSAYYFGVFSILSPITNVLTLNLSFYVMILGSIAALSGLVNIPIIKEFTIILFKITKFLMDFLTEIAEFISDFSFCTIPIHKTFLISAICICTVIIGTSYLIYKLKKRKNLKTISAVITVIVFFATTFVPLISPEYKNTLTVINSGEDMQIIIRSGLKYAYISNCNNDCIDNAFNNLPKATSESLCYYIPTYLGESAIYNLNTVATRYKPEETIISSELRYFANRSDIQLPENSVIKNQGYFTLNNEINFQIVDTYGMLYAIIESENKKAIVELHCNRDILTLNDSNDADVLVYKNRVPNVISKDKTVIISGSSSIYTDNNLMSLLKETENLYYTAKDGNVSINM